MWSNTPICDRDVEMRKRLRADLDDPEVRDHALRCAACREALAIAAWMQELAQLPLDNGAPLPNPAYLWWKAQVLQKWDAERQVTRPIDAGEGVQAVIGLSGSVLLLVWLWGRLQSMVTSETAALSPIIPVMMITSVVFLAITAVVAVRAFRTGKPVL